MDMNQIWAEETLAPFQSAAGRAAGHRESRMGDAEMRQPEASRGPRARESDDRSPISVFPE